MRSNDMAVLRNENKHDAGTGEETSSASFESYMKTSVEWAFSHKNMSNAALKINLRQTVVHVTN